MSDNGDWGCDKRGEEGGDWSDNKSVPVMALTGRKQFQLLLLDDDDDNTNS